MSKPTSNNITAIPIREFMQYTPLELVNGFKTDCHVLFEDNIVIFMRHTEIILNRYLFDVLAILPNLPLVSKYCIKHFYTNGIYTAKTLNGCLEIMLEDVVNFEVKPKNDRTILPLLYSRMQETFNSVYNEFVYDNIEFSASTDIEEYIELQFDDELISAMQDAAEEKTVQAVNKTYDVLDRVMKQHPENSIARGYISKTINPNQIKQMLASRGFVTEIDSNIFKYPIASSFVLGMASIYDLAIESRSAAKALFLSNRAVQQSEYFAREMQLVTMRVEQLVDGDCGNTNYIDWYVRPKTPTNKSDLPNLLGKRFLTADGKEDVVSMNHKHLEGTTIKMRSVLKCRVPDKRCVCTACFGDLSYGVHKHTNIGHYCSTYITQKLTQSILSTKHLTSSASSGDIVLDNMTRQFFNIKSAHTYMFKRELFQKSKITYKVGISQLEAFGIKDLNASVNVHKLEPSRVSRVRFITIYENNNGVEKSTVLEISENNKYGALTYEFLDYILKEGYILNMQDQYVVDLSNWNYQNGFIKMPQLEYNYLTLTKNIKSEFKNMKTSQSKTAKADEIVETQEALLCKLFDLINTKLDVNIAIIEVIVYSYSVMSIADNNYDIARNSLTPAITKLSNIIFHNSMSAVYAWEKVMDQLFSPLSFDGRNGIDHPMDVMIRPEETILDYYGKMP